MQTTPHSLARTPVRALRNALALLLCVLCALPVRLAHAADVDRFVTVDALGDAVTVRMLDGRLTVHAHDDPGRVLAALDPAGVERLTIAAGPRQMVTLVGELALPALHLTTGGQLAVEGGLAVAGDLQLEAAGITLQGSVTAAGIALHAVGLLEVAAGSRITSRGGTVQLQADALSLAGPVTAQQVEMGARHIQHMARIYGGQTVRLEAAETYVATTAATVQSPGGDVTIQAGHLFSSGRYDVAGMVGGDLRLSGGDVVLREAVLDASGQDQGGTLIVWADERADVTGRFLARSSRGDGGFAEVSAGEALAYAGMGDVAAPLGRAGSFLLDPLTLTIDAATGIFPQYELINPTPGAGDRFGAQVVVLSTGKVGVSDPEDDAVATNAGAVYLYDGVTGALISTLTGATAQAQIGGPVATNPNGVTALTNGNFVVTSPQVDIGFADDAGAATWVNGVTGLAGVVSSSNSLVGTFAYNTIGSGGVTPLANGNYVVSSPEAVSPVNFAAQAGAVTWGNGATGITGTLSDANSLLGGTVGDRIGSGGITALPNGNYVVSSPNYDYTPTNRVDAGAVTWGNGTIGVKGIVDASNSLVGSNNNDRIGSSGVIVLANGNYVVHSPFWQFGFGAVTFGLGTAALIGVVSSSNSLVGNQPQDFLGSGGIIVLPNGNYVVASPSVDFVANSNAGAVTWGSGTFGRIGTVSSDNSLVGVKQGDRVGFGGVIVLSNGHYVVGSPDWDNGGLVNAGAATWANGETGLTGVVSTTNSLYGTGADNLVGASLTALTNGHYVVSSPYWETGALTNLGAVTWGNGNGGTTGAVTPQNSLFGVTSNDAVGSRVYPLANGNYVVGSPNWDNASIQDAGAVTWANGNGSTTGQVSAANSLVGSSLSDEVGGGGLLPLDNGNYVVLSPKWDSGALADVGAVTLGNGTSGVTGPVSAANSLVGSRAQDGVGSAIVKLPNHKAVVLSPGWDDTGKANVGALTWINGATTLTGPVSTANSFIGSSAEDQVGAGVSPIIPFDNGNYLALSPTVDGSATDSGAVTWFDGATGKTLDGQNTVSPRNSILGQASNSTGTITGSAFATAAGNTFFTAFTREDGGRVRVGVDNPNLVTTTRAQGVDLTVHPEFIAHTLRSGNVTMQAQNTVTVKGPLDFGPPANAQRGQLTLQAGDKVLFEDSLALRLNDPAANQAERVNVLGGLQLSNVTLNLSAATPPTPGQRFTLLDNDGNDAVVGTFTGLAQDAALSVGGVPMRITYTGGDGNDVQVFAVQAPAITSTPITTATVGVAYSYDVDATGSPAPTFSLVSGPDGMTVNPATGLLQWTPAAVGSFPVTVRAANGIDPNADQNFTIVVSAQTGAVSGLLFGDANANGQQDQGELGIGGATVTLTPNAQVQVANLSGVTAADGSFTLTQVPVGQYSLSFSVADHEPPPAQNVTVSLGQTTNVPAVGAKPITEPTPDQDRLYLPAVQR